MSALILFRSLSRAQQGVRSLSLGGVPAQVMRAPRAVSERGCAFAAGMGEKWLDEALAVLSRAGVGHEGAFLSRPDGTWEEAAR